MDSYKITVYFYDGTRQVLKDDTDTDLYSLCRAVDKCEIKAFKVELKKI